MHNFRNLFIFGIVSIFSVGLSACQDSSSTLTSDTNTVTDSTGGNDSTTPIEETNKAYTRVDENGKPCADGHYILMGTYPQSYKTDDVVIDVEEPVENETYVGSDGERYLYYCRVYFKYEPIKWKILDYALGNVTATLLTEDIIEYKRFNDKNSDKDGRHLYNTAEDIPSNTYSLEYEYCSLRHYLNNEFFTTIFTLEEQSIVQLTDNLNDDPSAGYTETIYNFQTTKDRLFLPSYQDITNENYGFPADDGQTETRGKHGSDYMRYYGVGVGPNGNSEYGLRSPYKIQDEIFLIGSVARSIAHYGELSKHYVGSSIGIAPMMRIAL